MPDDGAKFFIASVSATMFDANLIVERDERGCFICKPRETVDGMGFYFAHHPLMFSWCTKDEARAGALQMAKNLFPEHEGWTNHDVMLWEASRSTFIQYQFFLSFRELIHRALQLAGFRSDAAG